MNRRSNPDALVIGPRELHMLAQAYEHMPSDTGYRQRRARTLREVAHDGSIQFVPDFLNRPSFGSRAYGQNDALIFMSPVEMRSLAHHHEEMAKIALQSGSIDDHWLHDGLLARASQLRGWADQAEAARPTSQALLPQPPTQEPT